MRHSLLLLAALASPVVLSNCEKTASTGVEIDSQLRRYIPDAATLVGGADIHRLTASQFYKRHESQLDVPMLNAASERLGIDLRRDVVQVLVAWQDNDPLSIVTGNFSASQLGPKLVSNGGSKFEYHAQTLFGDSNEAVYFPKQNVAVAGSPAALHRFIDGQHGRIPEPLRGRLDALPKSDQVWLVSSEGLPLNRIPLRSDTESALSNIAGYITAASIGAGLDQGAHFQADLLCISNEGAKRVHDALRGLIGMARLMTRDNEMDLLKLYDAIRVDQNGQNVRVHADLSSAEADKLLSMVPGIDANAEQMLQR